MKVVLFCAMLSLLYMHSIVSMEKPASYKPKSTTILESLINELQESSRHELNELLEALKKEDQQPNPQWPLVFFKGDEAVTKPIAIAMVAALQKTHHILLPKNYEVPVKVIELFNKAQQKKLPKDTVYIAQNLKNLIKSAKKSYKVMQMSNPNGHCADLLKGIVHSCLVIAIGDPTNQLPNPIKKLLLKPFGTIKTIITIKKDDVAQRMAQLNSLISDWCILYNIDYAYQRSLAPFNFENLCQISFEFTQAENIINNIFNRFKRYTELSSEECSLILQSAPLNEVIIRSIKVNGTNNKIPEAILMKIVQFSNSPKVNSEKIQEITEEKKYARTLDLTDLEQRIYNYDVQKKRLTVD